jgi:hypothetical protein
MKKTNKTNKSSIDEVWDLANSKDTLPLAQKNAERLIDDQDLIIFCGDRGKQIDQYSFYRIYNQSGKYRFALPGWLDLDETKFQTIDTIITKPSRDPSKSRNGGEYHEGYRIEKIPNRDIFRVTFSWALMSDFEDQCSDDPIICNSLKKVAEECGMEKLNLPTL